MVERKQVTFADLLNQRTWTDYNQFISESPSLYAQEVEQHVQDEQRLIGQLQQHPAFQNLTVASTSSRLAEAEELLSQGSVTGIDGTVAKYRLFSGLRCQIGVVAVNYAGDTIRHSFYISEAHVREDVEDAMERVDGRIASGESLSEMAVRGLMLYREREAGLRPELKQNYVLFHGPLLPFELLSGLGRLRALYTTIDVLRTIVRNKRFFSIISSSSYQDYLTFGRAIGRGEYLTAPTYTLAHHLQNSSSFLSYQEKWRESEWKVVESFLHEYASKIKIGVIRVAERPYVFHAHEDMFDLAAAIIARDAMFQREKGFPLLIDYADSLCSQYFPAGEFKALIEWELAKQGMYLSETPEQEMRLK